jgi:hypothetical protein
VKLLGRFGAASDASLLVPLAIESYGELRSEALAAALRLAPGIDGAARALLGTEAEDLVRTTLTMTTKAPVAEWRQHVEPLLNSKTDAIRTLAVAHLIERCSRAELKTLIDAYMNQGYYYYNVVCWLDRALYAPAPLRSVYLVRLERLKKSAFWA